MGRAIRSPTMRLLLLHGWGATGDDLAPLGHELAHRLSRRGAAVTVRSLEAPESHPAGGGARQWYPLDLGQPGWPDCPDAARLDLRRRLESELAQAEGEPVVVLGFSQGGAMALEAGLALPVNAILSCSGYPHARGLRLPAADTPAPSVLLVHGRLDPVVPAVALDQLQQSLRSAGVPVETALFACDHTIPPEALDAIASFLDRFTAAAGY